MIIVVKSAFVFRATIIQLAVNIQTYAYTYSHRKISKR
jgi:hypothetical protein